MLTVSFPHPEVAFSLILTLLSVVILVGRLITSFLRDSFHLGFSPAPPEDSESNSSGRLLACQCCYWLQPNRKGLLRVSVGTIRSTVWAALISDKSGFRKLGSCQVVVCVSVLPLNTTDTPCLNLNCASGQGDGLEGFTTFLLSQKNLRFYYL